MAYMALYRKWRPKTFSEVVGQKQVSETLARAIKENKVAHAYLFSGPRGTGKTSMAKIFARSINCVEGPTDSPCGVCGPCEGILRGDFIDVIEIDAASNRGIDEIRALRDNVRFLPVEGRKKVYIIDEAHMLTTEAWNALLKTIEEPPAHVMFIFATTEVDKLPVTIVSRCQRFAFRRISLEDMMAHLLYVAKESEISLTPAAAQVISVQADGGLRDALSLLDQCSGMAEGEITPAVVENLLGLVGKEEVLDVYDSIRRNEGAFILEKIKNALLEGREAMQFIRSLSEHLRSLLLQKVIPSADELRVYEGYRDRLKEQAEAISMGELQQLIAEVGRIESEAKRIENPRLTVEMGLLALAAGPYKREEGVPSSDGNNASMTQIMGRIAKLEAQLASGTIATVAPSSRLESMSVSTGPKGTPKVAPASPVTPTPKATAATTSKVSGGIRVEAYDELLKKALTWLSQEGMSFALAALKAGHLIYVDNVKAVLVFDTNFGVMMMQQSRFQDAAKKALSAVTGHTVEVDVFLSNSPEAMQYAGQKSAVIEAVKASPKPESEKAPEPIVLEKVESKTEAPKSLERGEDLPPVTSFEEELQELDGMLPPPEMEWEKVESELESVPEGAKKWQALHMTEEERNHPTLGKMLSAVTKEYDVYVQYGDKEEKHV